MTQKYQRQLVSVLKRINNKKGSAILTVMAFIMITVVLVASMLALAQMNLSNSIMIMIWTICQGNQILMLQLFPAAYLMNS